MIVTLIRPDASFGGLTVTRTVQLRVAPPCRTASVHERVVVGVSIRDAIGGTLVEPTLCVTPAQPLACTFQCSVVFRPRTTVDGVA